MYRPCITFSLLGQLQEIVSCKHTKTCFCFILLHCGLAKMQHAGLYTLLKTVKNPIQLFFNAKILFVG